MTYYSQQYKLCINRALSSVSRHIQHPTSLKLGNKHAQINDFIKAPILKQVLGGISLLISPLHVWTEYFLPFPTPKASTSCIHFARAARPNKSVSMPQINSREAGLHKSLSPVRRGD